MNFDGEILLDFSKSGKERPWRLHKTNSELLSESYTRLGWETRAERIVECGSHLRFNVCPAGHEKRLSWANFCRVRMCPMCSWRRSLIIAHQVKQIAHEATQRQPLKFLFLTPTIKNCHEEDLKETINHLMKSWDRLSKRKKFKNSVVGYFRVLEITRNPIDNTYHPHFHILLAVQPSYFKNKDKYIKHDEWVDLWKQSIQVDYTPVVDVRVVKNKRNIEKEAKILDERGIDVSDLQEEGDTLPGSAIAELAKYSTKTSDWLVYNRYVHKQYGKKVKLAADVKSGIDEEQTDRVVATLDNGLAYRRLLAFGGLLKDVWEDLRKEGKLEDVEDDNVDLIHINEDTKCKCSVCNSDMLEELYSWIPSLGNYMKKE